MSEVTTTTILGRLATQHYAEKAGAKPQCALEPVHYVAALEEAKRQMLRQCAALN